jgi:hypothetical protein
MHLEGFPQLNDSFRDRKFHTLIKLIFIRFSVAKCHIIMQYNVCNSIFNRIFV